MGSRWNAGGSAPRGARSLRGEAGKNRLVGQWEGCGVGGQAKVIPSMLGNLVSAGDPRWGVRVLGKRPGLPEPRDELWASCQICVFSWGWCMQLSSDSRSAPNLTEFRAVVR